MNFNYGNHSNYGNIPKNFSIAILQSEGKIKELTFSWIERGNLDACIQLLEALIPSQKTKLFSSTLEVHTNWADQEEKMTPLQYACFLGKLEVVKMLIAHGAEVNDLAETSDRTQRASLHFALDEGHSEIALFLISKEADDGLASCDTYHAFSNYNKLTSEDVGSKSCITALHMAIIKNMTEVVQALYEKGKIDISAQASGGNSALHFALEQGNEQIVNILKQSQDFNGLLDVKNNNSYTPREIAQMHGHRDLL